MKAQHAELSGWEPRRKVEERMKSLANTLARDPQLKSALAGRRRELGLSPSASPVKDLGKELAQSLGRGLGLGFSR